VAFSPQGGNKTQRASSDDVGEAISFPRAAASEPVRTALLPPLGKADAMLAASSFFLADPLRWALLGGDADCHGPDGASQ